MRKSQPQISEDKILEASWAILGEEGIEKLSMRKLAERLGIQAPSLYWYFKSKQDLYQRLANDIARIILSELKSEGEWKEQLHDFAVTTKNVLKRYPCSTQIMMMTLPNEPNLIRFTNRLLQCVEDTSLTEEQKIQVVTTMLNYVYFFVLDDYQHQLNVAAMSKQRDELPGEELIALLNTMPEKEVGLFRNLFMNGLFEMMGTNQAFEFGLKVILLGIEQVMIEKK
ncbi:TetR/AcrR family transcriptional regulator C-terminal domain-containing protein [Kurthia gibsonii]|uniref:TetR/AcrR family transcriptional regulator C-terminal domain-containing protein n=1 Tax=Kurthia TaxID=1649 RepID=UPI002D6924A6|nr:TetR/AcrR family transcriptional regulator C-terminal domain-containing protein [Kurthia gibsonii]MEB6112663.1 TetR/AcrR family transcriptional regulator C-terminal domain-containing protein [Kurthia gibsonii]HZG12948.1 TetR/AcrR family transcriptional regulator C-terminal domain-containing protein [Kurthia gibsonii]